MLKSLLFILYNCFTVNYKQSAGVYLQQMRAPQFNLIILRNAVALRVQILSHCV